MKKNLKRAFALVLAAAMTLSLAACGGKKEQEQDDNNKQNVTEKKEFVWVAEYLGLDKEKNYYNMTVSGDYLYYMNSEWDEERETSHTSIASISCIDGSAGPEIKLPEPEKKDGDGSNRNVDRFMVDGEGNLTTLETIYHWNEETMESSREYFLCKYSSGGELLFEQDITDTMMKDGNETYIQYADMDGEGRIYLVGDSAIQLFSAEGKYDGTISMDGDSWPRGIGAGKDGKMYVAVNDRSSSGNVLKEIDYEGKKLGQGYSGYVSNSDGGIATGLEADFMGSDGMAVYEYDLASQSTQKLFDWLDCDVNGTYVNYMKAMEDGRIMALYNNYETEETDLIFLTKKPAAEVPEKVELTIGMLYRDSEFYSAAVAFNKNSDKYHINIRTYFDDKAVVYTNEDSNYQEVMQDAVTRMNNDITSDNCPDMLSTRELNVAKYASKGLFEDMGAMLDNSSKLKRSDYFENILEAYTYDGVLVAVPKSFSLSTLIGRASDLGNEPGWTLAEMLAYGDAHPKAKLFANATQESALQMMLRYSQGSFVDWETGKCSFDSESFEQILELASRFPKDWEYDEDAPSYPVLIASGEVLLDNMGLYDFESIQLADAFYENDVCFIGYPNENGESGTYLEASAGLTITTKCRDKEGAWSFVESWLAEKPGRFNHGFSSNKNIFAEARAEATKVEYVLDEEGNPVLDEEGNPIVQGAGGGIGYGDDWEYTYHVSTEEEVDRLEALIKSAKPSASSDTQIMSIITEEAQAFFSGQRTAKDVAGIIQSRVQVYVNENS